MPRAQKLHALGQRALRILQNVAELIDLEFHSGLKSQASSVGIAQILRPTRAKKLQSFRKISVRRAQKSCVNSASVVARTVGLRSSSFPSRCALERKITRESSVEITQDLRKNRAKSLQNF